MEAALSAALSAIAASMAKAAPGDLVALADRMGDLARELEARRLAKAGIVLDLETEARKRGRR